MVSDSYREQLGTVWPTVTQHGGPTKIQTMPLKEEAHQSSSLVHF